MNLDKHPMRISQITGRVGERASNITTHSEGEVVRKGEQKGCRGYGKRFWWDFGGRKRDVEKRHCRLCASDR